jgi:hypothetical protein
VLDNEGIFIIILGLLEDDLSVTSVNKPDRKGGRT